MGGTSRNMCAEEQLAEEVWDVIDQGLTHWKSTRDGEVSVDMGEADEYIDLARQGSLIITSCSRFVFFPVRDL